LTILLINDGLAIKASQQKKYKFVIGIALGQTNLKEIIGWLKNHVVKNST